MSVDLVVVCPQRPDLEVCERLTRFAVQRWSSPVELSTVWVHEPAEGYHEYEGEHVVVLEAAARSQDTYALMLVMACATAVLYGGRLIDEARFFPPLETGSVLRRCLCGEASSASGFWRGLHGT